MKILITGCAGFIGFSFSKYLLEKKYNVVGIDNINDYYSTSLKKDRLKELKKFKKFNFFQIDLINQNKLSKIFDRYKFTSVFHFAAQAGVRYSVEQPRKYIDSNINAFFNLIEEVKKKKIVKFFYASSSSVYGDSKKFHSPHASIRNGLILLFEYLFRLYIEFKTALIVATLPINGDQ